MIENLTQKNVFFGHVSKISQRKKSDEQWTVSIDLRLQLSRNSAASIRLL